MSRTGARLTQGLLGSGSGRGGSFVISRCQTQPNEAERGQKRPQSSPPICFHCFVLPNRRQAGGPSDWPLRHRFLEITRVAVEGWPGGAKWGKYRRHKVLRLASESDLRGSSVPLPTAARCSTDHDKILPFLPRLYSTLTVTGGPKATSKQNGRRLKQKPRTISGGCLCIGVGLRGMNLR